MHTRYLTEFTEEKSEKKLFSQSFVELAKRLQNIPNKQSDVSERLAYRQILKSNVICLHDPPLPQGFEFT